MNETLTYPESQPALDIVCDACLYVYFVSILFLISAVTKAFTGLTLTVVCTDSYSWCLAFVCIFALFLR